MSAGQDARRRLNPYLAVLESQISYPSHRSRLSLCEVLVNVIDLVRDVTVGFVEEITSLFANGSKVVLGFLGRLSRRLEFSVDGLEAGLRVIQSADGMSTSQ